MRSRVEELRQQLGEADLERTAREEERIQLAAEREAALLERDEAEEAVRDLTVRTDRLDTTIGDLSGEIEEAGAQLRRHQGEAQKLVRDRNECDNLLGEARVRSAELHAQIQYLEQEGEDEFALTVQEIREELQKAQETEAAWRERQEQERQRRREERRAARQAGTSIEEESVEEAAPAPADAPEDAETEKDLEEGEPVTTPDDDAIDDPARLRAVVADLRQKLARMGAVNEAAIVEYAEISKRLEFLHTQRDDLLSAKEQLEEAIARIDETTKRLFDEALEAIRRNFSAMFVQLFGGGEADLRLVQDERFPEPGIDIFAQPPGKKIGESIPLMSGGERALTAIALMFALFQYRPSPICILDEIDAPLDDANVVRMCEVLKTYARNTQFLVITHNKITMSLADTIYGVTMQERGVSKVVSVRFEEAEKQGLLDDSTPIQAVGAGA